MHLLIFSGDPEFIAAFQSAAEAFKQSAIAIADPVELMAKVSSQPCGLAVVDLDPKSGGAGLLPQIRSLSANREIVVFAGATNETSESVIASGANVVMYKPIQLDMAKRHLRDALMIAEGDRRQFNRVPLSGLASLRSAADGEISGVVLNVGEGGVALKLQRAPMERGPVVCRFRLPDDSEDIVTTGKITWADPAGNVGVRFLEAGSKSHKRLSEWISLVEGVTTGAAI